MHKAPIALIAVLMAASAGHAFADCEEAQEDFAGKAVVRTAVAKVGATVPVTGKQMIDVTECNAVAGGLFVSFKYNFLGADGLYWMSGTAKVKGTEVNDFKVVSMSPNLAAATAAKGVKLASN